MAVTKDQILTTLDAALKRSGADATEAVFVGVRDATTRFAENGIHQNMASSDGRVIVRLMKDGRVAVSSTNDLSPAGLDRAVADAMEIASFLTPDTGFPGFVRSESARVVKAFDPSVDGCPPDRRSSAVAQIVDQAKAAGVQASGLFRLTTNRVAVANTAGTRQYHEETIAELSVSAADDPTLGQGWSIGVSHHFDQLDPKALGRIAIDKAVRSRNPQPLPAAEYTVILEPAAVGQLLLFLGFLAFSGKSFAEGRGVLSGKIGEAVTGTNITVYDDPLLPAYPGMPFDFEGIPKRKIALIENGVAKGMAHDSRSAKLAGVESTGHALPADNPRGPYPKNLTLMPGDGMVDQMVASTSMGLLITHFWYVNYLNPMKAQVSGSTRDGTFLIENGVVTRPVRNLRATPAILEAFSKAERIGKDRVLYPQYSSVLYVPAMKITSMAFVEDTD
jgi:predicted Zn-dependent protease